MKLPIPIPSLGGLLKRFRKRGTDETEELDEQQGAEDDAERSDASDDTAVANEESPADVEDFEEDFVGDDEDETAEPTRSPPNWRRVAGLAAAILLAVVLLGGIGTVVGWLVVNAKQAATDRERLRPTVSVEILADGEGAPANSSLDSMKFMADAENGDDAKAADDIKEAKETDEAAPPADPMAGIINPDLVQETENGPLPIIAADGRRPWIEYSRAFDSSDRRPRLAIIVSNLGLSPRTTDAALQALPPEVTLSFSPLTPDLMDWVGRARRKGHEVLIDLPMEPIGFPRSDPGRDTLLTSASEVENLNRLESVMKRAGGYVGLLGSMGSRFTVNAESLGPILQILKERGLLYVDSRATSRSMGPELASTIQLPRAFSNRFIDNTPSLRAIDGRLAELESIAKISRYAIGLAQPYPVTLDRLAAWLPSLNAKGIALAPVTAVADKQSLR